MQIIQFRYFVRLFEYSGVVLLKDIVGIFLKVYFCSYFKNFRLFIILILFSVFYMKICIENMLNLIFN